MARVVVVGGSFAGLTGALEAKRKLGKGHEVILISKTENFVYIPSLIWVPFGWRNTEDLSVPLKPILDKAGIKFVHDAVTKVDPEKNRISTTKDDFDYDYLLLGSGVDIRFDMIDGLGPHGGHTYSVCTPDHAMHAREGWEKFIKDPGPVVIGASQGASCMGAAYEFLFNFEYACRKAGVRKKVDITWITPEPFLAHFGIDGMKGGEALVKVFMKIFNINFVTNSEIEKVTEDTVILRGGKKLPFKYSMIIPPFNGAKFVKESGDLGDEKGFIPTHDTYQHKKYPNVFAAGLAVQLPAPWKSPVAMGVPKTGYPSDETAKVAAGNIVSLINGKRQLHAKPMGKIPGLCVLDAGNKEVIIVTNHLLKPRQFAIMIPNPLINITKRILEKYFLWKTRTAKSYLL